MSLEAFYQFLSLDRLNVRTDDPFLEALFWANIDPPSLRFWPRFLLLRRDLEERFGKQCPASLSIENKGFGSIDAVLSPLSPWVAIRWRDREYYLTKEGYVWESGLPVNMRVAGIRRPEGPPLIFGEDFPSPSGEGSQEGQIIFRTVLPMDVLVSWMEGLAASGWHRIAREIRVSRREGRFLLELKMDIQGRRFSVLLHGDPPRWSELASAVSQILRQLQYSGEPFIIDTTYSDRIVVRGAAGGDQEGSGR